MWSKKWYLKRNISCDVHLLNELLETDVPWDDAIVVSAGKLWDSLNELSSSLCERQLERTVLRPALLPVKTAQFTQFLLQVWRHTVSNLGVGKKFSPSPKFPDRLWWPPSSLLICRYRLSFAVEKRVRHEANHTAQSDAVVRKKWSSTSTISFEGLNRHRFTHTDRCRRL